MKKLILSILVIVTGISCTKAQKTAFSDESLASTLKTFENNDIAFKNILEKHAGKTIVIEVWASWCSDCIKAMPKLKELQSNNPEVDYIFISMDKAEDKWKAGIEKHELKGDHYWATDGMESIFAKATDIDWIPRYIIIDKTGKIITYRAIETDFQKINTTLKSLK